MQKNKLYDSFVHSRAVGESASALTRAFVCVCVCVRACVCDYVCVCVCVPRVGVPVNVQRSAVKAANLSSVC